ncbi:MAG: hypothetical protein GX410_03060 [Elusimicrobia bacterium]|nr:hypothetical protein [Elusimicrobiota bacterium]
MSDQLIAFFEPIVGTWSKFVETVPNLLSALLFLLIGLTLARLISSMVEKALQKINLDNYTSKIGINEILARIGFGKSSIVVLSFIIYWSIILVFVTVAANALNLSAISMLLEKFMKFVPQLVVAVALAFGGLLFGRFTHDVILSSSTANNLRGGATLAKTVQAVIIVVAALAALRQLQIDTTLLDRIMLIFFGALGLAFALAFGLGGREEAARILRNLSHGEDEQKK